VWSFKVFAGAGPPKPAAEGAASLKALVNVAAHEGYVVSNLYVLCYYRPSRQQNCCQSGSRGASMNVYFQCFVTIPFLVVLFQLYCWSVALKGVEKQKYCRGLGIAYTTAGTTCLMFRSLPFAVAGLILFMLGLRLIAHGLDRLDKSVFIDRLDDDR
jgi:hypothetical protein